MSKRKNDGSPAIHPPSSQDILNFYFSSKESKSFQKVLSARVRRDAAPTDATDTLLSSLEQLGFNFDSIRAVFSSPELQHCVRCHEEFSPRKNNASACKIAHNEAPSESWKEKTEHGTYQYQYNCCGETFAGFDEDPDDLGDCFVGSHTADEGKVKYNGENICRCDEVECPAAGSEDEDSDDDSIEFVGEIEPIIVSAPGPPTKRLRGSEAS